MNMAFLQERAKTIVIVLFASGTIIGLLATAFTDPGPDCLYKTTGQKSCRAVATFQQQPVLSITSMILLALATRTLRTASSQRSSRTGEQELVASSAAGSLELRADAAQLPPSAATATQLSASGTVTDASGVLWWFDLPEAGPSRLTGTIWGDQPMRVLIGIPGTWTQDLGHHVGAIDLAVQLPAPKACISITPADPTAAEGAATPVSVRIEPPGAAHAVQQAA